MSDEHNQDIAKLANTLADAISETAWNQIVETACHTFKEVVSPITSLTGGIGRLIRLPNSTNL